jgi:hypothetical protein
MNGILKHLEPVKAAPGKRKKEMTKQKEAPEAKKQKVEGKPAKLGKQIRVALAQVMSDKGT